MTPGPFRCQDARYSCHGKCIWSDPSSSNQLDSMGVLTVPVVLYHLFKSRQQLECLYKGMLNMDDDKKSSEYQKRLPGIPMPTLHKLKFKDLWIALCCILAFLLWSCFMLGPCVLNLLDEGILAFVVYWEMVRMQRKFTDQRCLRLVLFFLSFKLGKDVFNWSHQIDFVA